MMSLKELIASDPSLASLAEKSPELVDALQVAIDENDPATVQARKDKLVEWFNSLCGPVLQDIRTGGLKEQDQVLEAVKKWF